MMLNVLKDLTEKKASAHQQRDHVCVCVCLCVCVCAAVRLYQVLVHGQGQHGPYATAWQHNTTSMEGGECLERLPDPQNLL